MKKPAMLVSLVVFWIIAIGHVLRIVFQLDFIIGDVVIPLWASILPVIFFAVLGAWLWVERRR